MEDATEIPDNAEEYVILPHILVEEVYKKLGHGTWKKDTNRQAQLIFGVPWRKARFIIYKGLRSTDLIVYLSFVTNHNPVLSASISLYRPDFDPHKMVDDIIEIIETIKEWHKNNRKGPKAITSAMRTRWQNMGKITKN